MNESILCRAYKTAGLILVISLTLTANVLADSSSQIDNNFARELKLLESLKVYNEQLLQQIDAQDTAKKDIAVSIDNAKTLEPQIVPLMAKMLETLDKFIKADLPFHQDIRTDSVKQLEKLMLDTTASTPDRFRSIMDIYAIEMEYGNTYEAYSDTQRVNGEEIEVDMLRVGRLALYYQTKDGKISGVWDRKTSTWAAVPEEMNRHLRKAIKVAAKQIAPELMSLLISAPEEV